MTKEMAIQVKRRNACVGELLYSEYDMIGPILDWTAVLIAVVVVAVYH